MGFWIVHEVIFQLQLTPVDIFPHPKGLRDVSNSIDGSAAGHLWDPGFKFCILSLF